MQSQFILGIGTDIIEIHRIHQAFSRFGRRFLKKIFTKSEIDYCLSLQNPIPSLAVRFAAKEAISKSIGTGITKELFWTDIEIIRTNGAPSARLNKEVRVQGLLPHFHISLSHSRDYATATAIAFTYPNM